MADDKTVELRVDASEGEQALAKLAASAKDSAEAMGRLGVELQKTTEDTKRIVTANREYNAALRANNDSAEAAQRLARAYSASIADQSNTLAVKMRALEDVARKSVGGAMDEARAADLAAAGQKRAAEAVLAIATYNATLGQSVQTLSGIEAAAAAAAESNAQIRINATLKEIAARQQAQRDSNLSYLSAESPSGGKSAGVSAGVFAAAFREEDAAAEASAAALVRHERALQENIRVAAQWETMLENEARALRDAAAAEAQKAQRAQSLLATYAPAIVQAERLAQAEQELKALIASGAGPLAAYNSALQGVQIQKAALTVASRGTAGAFRNLGMIAQQAGYQIGDIASVSAAGGNAFATAGTQVGQFLGVLGPWGAAAGAAVTVAGALAVAMSKDEAAAAKAAQAVKDYAAALDSAVPVIDRYNKARDKAEGRPDSWRDEVKAISDVQEQIRLLSVRRAELQATKDDSFGLILPGPDAFREIDLKLLSLRATLFQLQNTPKQTAGITAADSVLTSAQPKRELESKSKDLEAGMVQAKANGDKAALERLTEAHAAVNRAISTWVTEGQRAVLMEDAKAKAVGMSESAAKKFLAEQEAEIGMRGKVIELGEYEKNMAAARAGAHTEAAKVYIASQKAISAAAIENHAALAMVGLDAEREALAQRRALGEISAAEELTLAIAIEDRKRAVELSSAQQKLALMRKNEADNLKGIDAAERAITELQAKHEAERQKNRDAATLADRQRAKRLAEIEISDGTSKGNSGVAAREENLSFNKSMGNISGADEIAELRAIAEEKISIRREELEATLQLAGIEEDERRRINKELVGLERQRSLDMSKIDHQATRDRLQEVTAWTEPFKSAVNSTVTGFISGTLTKQQAAARAAQSIAASYLGKFATIATDAFNKHVLMAAWDRLFGAQEVATKTAVEARKATVVSTGQAAQTTATRMGAVARASAGTTEDMGFFARVGRQIAEWLGMEEIKTGATATGEAIRTGVTTTGAVAREGVDTAQTTASVGTSAARGAAGTYADASEHIPYGWLVAPALAAAAFVAIKAFSSRGGEAEVPGDGLLYTLHAKETVLPASYAVPLREALTSGALSGKKANPMAAPPALTEMVAALPQSALRALSVGALGVPALGGGMPALGPAAQRWGMPADLSRTPGAAAASNIQNSTVNRGGDIHFQQTVNVTGKVRTDDIENFAEESAKAIAKLQRNGNTTANSIRGRKK